MKVVIKFCSLLMIAFIVTTCFSQTRINDFLQNNLYFDSLNVVYKQKQFDSLFTFIVANRNFNGVMLIAQDDKILYENVAGFADFTTKKPLDIHSSFEIGSMSKMFTAVSILLLYEEGKIDLSKKIIDYIPDFPYSEITIHQLLCHRSGLPEYFSFAEKYHKNPSFPLTNDSLLLMLQKHKPKCSTEPDDEFEYNNTGYAVLASIVEKVSGMPFKQFLETKIFEPLEMKETFLYQFGSSQEIILGHKGNKKIYYRNFMSGVVGDKGIFSSINDLYTWDKAIFSGKIIKKETLALATTPQNPDKNPCNNYGYGFHIGCTENKQSLIYHGGLWNGNHSLFVHRASDNTVIIILSNIYNKSFMWKSYNILHILDEL